MAKTDKALGVNESSQVVVETVQKVSVKHDDGPQGPTMPKFNSDASKVTCKGLGLKKAHPGRQNNFTINASQAGEIGVTIVLWYCKISYGSSLMCL